MSAPREPLAAVRWPLGLLLALAVLTFALAVAGSALAFLVPAVTGLAPAWRRPVQLAILVVQYAVPLLLAATWVRRHGAPWREGFLLRRTDVAEGLGLAVFAGLGARVLNTVYGAVMVLLHVKAPADTDPTRLFGTSAAGLVCLALLAVAVAPVAEELLFRGVIYPGLRDRYGRFSATVVSAGVFALFHAEPYVFLPIMVLGVALALLAEKTRSVWPGIVAHALFNGTAMALLLLARTVGAKAVMR